MCNCRLCQPESHPPLQYDDRYTLHMHDPCPECVPIDRASITVEITGIDRCQCNTQPGTCTVTPEPKSLGQRILARLKRFTERLR